ncbi:hypothetical protein Hypma_005256 [Hypsizygus marmoreus]|uniref:Uncharacterized protein n=1 Tax=Hypsizygus marmoreus TaxID=39966 RepID=A0A369JZM7_HYPMA|nr:hypothetical protein Hypma_005256 [Hypsizygus marmoreus]
MGRVSEFLPDHTWHKASKPLPPLCTCAKALIEEAICKTNQLLFSEKELIYDINEDDEIQTVWSLSYDGFNLLMNKAAEKSISVGSLAMVCLSLLPSIHYRLENMFLPALDGLNLYLALLIKELDLCYHKGTWLSQTPEHAHG